MKQVLAAMVTVLAAAALIVALQTTAATGAVTKTKTIRLKADVIEDATPYTIDGTARCAGKFLLIVDLPSDVISYQASVDQPGVGPFDFSGPPFTNPITGFGNPYRVPKGKAGWFLGGDSGPGPCAPLPPGKYIHIKASGVVPVSGGHHGGAGSGGGGGSAKCVVPKVVGTTLTAARRAITRADCRVGKLQYSKTTGPAGLVLLTSPRPGSTHPAGTRVNLIVSKH